VTIWDDEIVHETTRFYETMRLYIRQWDYMWDNNIASLKCNVFRMCIDENHVSIDYSVAKLLTYSLDCLAIHSLLKLQYNSRRLKFLRRVCTVSLILYCEVRYRQISSETQRRFRGTTWNTTQSKVPAEVCGKVDLHVTCLTSLVKTINMAAAKTTQLF
jgi:hypothetical protein